MGMFTEDDDEDFKHSLIMNCLFESIKATDGLSDLLIPSCKLKRTDILKLDSLFEELNYLHLYVLDFSGN